MSLRQFRYDPSQPRADDGKWTDIGGASLTGRDGGDHASVAGDVVDGDHVTVSSDDVDDVVSHFAKADAPVDLTLVTVDGRPHMFSAMRGNGMPRSKMPQISKDNLPAFQDRLRESGVEFENDEVDPATLKATQSELDGRKVGGIMNAMRDGTMEVNAGDPIWVSSDGHILDGHHRWAAAASISADCDGCVKIPVIVVDMPMARLLKFANEFNDDMGVERKGFGQFATEPVVYAMATDEADGITDEDLADLAHGDGSAFTDEDEELSSKALRQFRFNPNQPRADDGTWTSAGGVRATGSSGSSQSEVVGDSGASNYGSLGDSVPLPSRGELEAGFDPVPDTPEVESTLLNHLDRDGNLTAERRRVHDGLIIEQLTDPSTGAPYPEHERPKALIMGGGAASGKSTAIAAGFVDAPEGAVTINPDEFKVALPESSGPSSDGKQGNGLADKYGPAWAAITHEESSHLGKRLTTAAIERRNNILIDKTSSDGPKAVKEIKRLQNEGYDVEVAYVTTEVDQAVSNAMSRQAKTGRAVPETVLRAGHTGANAAFLDVASQTSARARLVTTLPANSDGSYRAPVLTAETDGNGGLFIHDQGQWDAYLGRVPAVPDNLRFLDALVASSGTVRFVIGEDRLKVLYGNAMVGARPDDLTAEEVDTLDALTREIAEMREQGIAFDYPINDIFAGEGTVAVLKLSGPTPRTFRA